MRYYLSLLLLGAWGLYGQGVHGVFPPPSGFPGAQLRGTFLGSGLNNSASAGTSQYFFQDSAAPITACATPSTAYWMNPTAGYVRNTTVNTSGANGSTAVHFNVAPGCAQPLGTFQSPNGGVTLAPGSAAGGYINSGNAAQTDFTHVNQYAPLAYGWNRTGNTNSAVLSSIGAEFISDDGTADSILAFAQTVSLTASLTQFLGFDQFLSNTEGTVAMPLPIPGTLKRLMFSNGASPTAAVAVTVRKNGSNTAITQTIGGGDTAQGNYVDVTHTASVVAGDYIDVQTVSGATTQTDMDVVTLLFVPTDGTSAILHGQISGTVTTTNKYGQPFSGTTSATETSAEYTSPIACSVSNLYVYQSTANTVTTVTTFTLRQNEAPTALTGTIGITVTGSQLVDGTHSVAIAAGDRLSLQYITNTGTSGTMGGWSAQCN